MVRRLVAACILPLLLGAAILTYGTRAGVGIYPDSVMYIQGARSIQQHHGFTLSNADGTFDPITLFPPLYSVVLSFASQGFPDVIDVLRGTQISLYLISLLGLMAIVAVATGGSIYAVLGAGLLGVFATDVMSFQAIALSEGLFLACTLLAFVLMQEYLAKSRLLFLIGAALMTSAAWLSRYAGGAWVLGGVLTLWILSRHSIRRKWIDSILFAGIACAANVYWIYRNARVGEGAFGRTFHLNDFFGSAQIASLMTTFRMWTWRLTDAHAKLFLLFYALLFAGLLMTLRRPGAQDERADERLSQGIWQSLLYAMSYGLLILVSAMFFQGDMLLDSMRLLIPLHVLLILFVVLQVYRLMKHRSSKPARGILFLSACLMLGAGSRAMRRWLEVSALPPYLMYSAPAYRDSPTIAALRKVPMSTVVYSNLGYPVTLYTGRTCVGVPRLIDNNTGRPNEHFEQEMKEMREAASESEELLVLFNKGDDWLVLPSLKQIAARIQLKPFATFPDAKIWRVLPDLKKSAL